MYVLSALLIGLPVRIIRGSWRKVVEIIDLGRVAGLTRAGVDRGECVPGETEAEKLVRLIHTDPPLFDMLAEALAVHEKGVNWKLCPEETRKYWRGRLKEKMDTHAAGERDDDVL